MLMRVFRGLIVGLFAAVGAMALNADFITLVAMVAIPVVVAMVDVLAGEIFTLFVVFGVGAIIWSWTPLGKYVMSIPTVQKYQEKSQGTQDK